MRVVFMGTPAFSVPALQAIHAAGHEIIQVYTRPPAPAGRGMKLKPSPVHEVANALGLTVSCPENFKTAETVDEFTARDCDLAVVVAYGLILPRALLQAPGRGCWNIHASLLPRWRGAAPIQRAIMAGDEKTGVAIMQMEAGLDTGPVLHLRDTPIHGDDTSAQLHMRLADLGAVAIVEAMDMADKLQPQPQAEAGICYAEKIDKAEARIDWTRSAADVDRHIRGLSPFPGAWFEVDGTRIKVLAATPVNSDGPAGQVMTGDPVIACGGGGVCLDMVQRAGKAAMAGADFMNGGLLSPGQQL
ncbi:MAG: methionyl-tRNA formyltransferase [PS1 clade bacterium]|nr:methionyl-tRNA formyltransferase [PS1 clade bacterium]